MVGTSAIFLPSRRQLETKARKSALVRTIDKYDMILSKTKTYRQFLVCNVYDLSEVALKPSLPRRARVFGMNQSYRASKLFSAAPLWGALVFLCFSTSAFAQSAGAFATSPYIRFAPPAEPVSAGCQCAGAKPAAISSVIAKPITSGQPASSTISQVLPIVMFRGTPAEPLTRPTLVSMIPPADFSPQVAPKPAVPVLVTPPPVAKPVLRVAATPVPSAKRKKPAGPFKRIWRDTKKSVVEDIPEALADALPWVDRTDKDEPIEQVLARISADLSRASAKDPEWIYPAEGELRELSKRLATLADPPVAGIVGATVATLPEQDTANRPFRPRPIWPGTNGRPEMQSRPTALVTGSTIQQGPEAIGQRLPPPTDWVEEEEQASKPLARQVVANRSKRPTK
jgi:hypothetical protein